MTQGPTILVIKPENYKKIVDLSADTNRPYTWAELERIRRKADRSGKLAVVGIIPNDRYL